MDSDSRLTPGWVAQVLETFDATPGLVALSGPVVYYGLSPRESCLRPHLLLTWAWIAYAINRYILRVGSMVQGGNFILTRTALEQIGGFNLAITFYGEDTDIARRLNEVGDRPLHLRVEDALVRPPPQDTKACSRMAFRYSLNYFWTTFLERPFTNTHNDIREINEEPQPQE